MDGWMDGWCTTTDYYFYYHCCKLAEDITPTHHLSNPFRDCIASATCMSPGNSVIEEEDEIEAARRRSSSGGGDTSGVVKIKSPTSVALAVHIDKEERYSTAGSMGADSMTGVVSEYFTFER